MSERGQQRKKQYVDSAIQGGLMFRFATYWVVYHVALWHAMFIYAYIQQYRMNQLMIAADKLPEGASPISFAQMYSQFFEANHSVLLCAAAMLPVFLWDLMKLAHRIAGPLVRFRDVLGRLTRGEKVDRVRLRKGDLMSGLESSFNEYLDALNAGEIPEHEDDGLTTEDEERLESINAEIDEAPVAAT